MHRYFCTYFITNDDAKINKHNKRTLVIEAPRGHYVISILTQLYNAKRIKRIRDLSNPKPYIYDAKLDKLEQFNNYKLWLTQDPQAQKNYG